MAEAQDDVLALADELGALGGGSVTVARVQSYALLVGPLVDSGVSVEQDSTVLLHDPTLVARASYHDSTHAYPLTGVILDTHSHSLSRDVDACLSSGYNATLVVHGQTSCGKSRFAAAVLADVLKQVYQQRRQSDLIAISAWEVYGRQLHDLLANGAVTDMHAYTSAVADTHAQAVGLLRHARAASESWSADGTAALSARSHVFYRVLVYDPRLRSCCTLHVVDVASAQQAASARASNSHPLPPRKRRFDAALLNQDLLALSRAVQDLAVLEPGSGVVKSARDSLLTRVLVPLISSGAKTWLVSAMHTEPLHHTACAALLRTAVRAMDIAAPCERHVNVDIDQLDLVPAARVLTRAELHDEPAAVSSSPASPVVPSDAPRTLRHGTSATADVSRVSRHSDVSRASGAAADVDATALLVSQLEESKSRALQRAHQLMQELSRVSQDSEVDGDDARRPRRVRRQLVQHSEDGNDTLSLSADTGRDDSDSAEHWTVPQLRLDRSMDVHTPPPTQPAASVHQDINDAAPSSPAPHQRQAAVPMASATISLTGDAATSMMASRFAERVAELERIQVETATEYELKLAHANADVARLQRELSQLRSASDMGDVLELFELDMERMAHELHALRGENAGLKRRVDALRDGTNNASLAGGVARNKDTTGAKPSSSNYWLRRQVDEMRQDNVRLRAENQRLSKDARQAILQRKRVQSLLAERQRAETQRCKVTKTPEHSDAKELGARVRALQRENTRLRAQVGKLQTLLDTQHSAGSASVPAGTADAVARARTLVRGLRARSDSKAGEEVVKLVQTLATALHEAKSGQDYLMQRYLDLEHHVATPKRSAPR